MRIGVLGATGPVGEEVVRICLARGHDPVAVSSNPAKLDAFATRYQIDRALVDIRDRVALTRQAAEMEAFVVTAGVAPAALAAQVDMIESVLSVAGDRVSVVYVSSCWSYAPLRQEVLTEEHTRSGDGPSAYRRQAEDMVTEAGGVVLHLPDFYGPGVHTSPLQRLIQRAVAGRTLTWPARWDTIREHAYIQDIGEPIVRVVEKAIEAASRHLIMGGSGPIDFAGMVRHIRSTIPRKVRAVSLGALPQPALVALDPWSRHLRGVIGEYRKPVSYDDSALVALVGETPVTSYETGILATVSSLRPGQF